MDIIAQAQEQLDSSLPKTTNERIVTSRKIKELILSLNQIFKENKDSSIMDLMKALTERKRKIDKRLKGNTSI